jgi:hypothetical protein
LAARKEILRCLLAVNPKQAEDQITSAPVISLATKYAKSVMPDLIRHPVPAFIPAFAGMKK